MKQSILFFIAVMVTLSVFVACGEEKKATPEDVALTFVSSLKEGRYDEAVVPLGNSPQMKQFADSVADRVNNGEQIRLLRDQNDLLKQILDKTGVYLDGREITRVVNMNQKVDARAYGR